MASRYEVIADSSWEGFLSYARRLSVEEMRRHANVSIDNNHSCRECFTCACVEALRELRVNRNVILNRREHL